MRCKDVRKSLMAYHDGEVRQRLGRKISRHLLMCTECSQALDVLRESDRAVGMAGIPDPGSEYWESFTGRVMEKVRKESDAPDPLPKKARREFSPVRLAPALSIALVVVVAVGVLMKARQPGIPVPQLPEVNKETARSIPSSPKGGQEILPKAEEKVSSEDEALDFSLRKRATRPDLEQRVLPEGGAAVQEVEPGGRLAPSAAPFKASPVIPPAQAEEPSSLSGVGKDLLREAPPVSDMDPDDGSWGQLAFARSLEAQGKHVESEEVLVDLLAQNPAVPVKEQASLLLVSVLRNQSRIPEARQVLRDAQREYPANTMIQNFRVE